MTSKLATIAATVGLTLCMTTASHAAIEIDEEDFGPTYETMVVDTLVGKPLQLLSALTGTAAYVVSYPFTAASDSTDEAYDKLLYEPWQAMKRCLGCSVAEDNFYKSQKTDDNEVRIVVDQPSEIIINTDDHVVIVPQ